MAKGDSCVLTDAYARSCVSCAKKHGIKTAVRREVDGKTALWRLS